MTSKTNSKKVLITSALPYVNNVPHLGNIIGCVLSADVFARFSRSMGKETRFICGTDEHGTTTEAKALEEKMSPKEVCDKYYKIHKKIYDWFGCSFDAFGRTSSKANHEISQHIFKKLQENGYIVEDDMKQMYCKKCDKFLADRFVEGTCPKCGFDGARGDQCDDCGNMLNPDELKDPKCKTCGSSPVVKVVRHLFMDLPKISPDLKKWIESREKNWSDNAQKMTSSWLRDGLRNRCITRDLKWGVKVPAEGFTDKVFYSWFDAPIGYIGITIDNYDDWKDWWLNDKDVNLYQFMGKDNIPFHTIMFPSFLIGTKENYTLLHQISSTEYLNYESGKFSKSNKTGVFGDDAMSTGIPADVFRYYLLANRPENSDTEFSWKDFQERNNSELLSNLGNFVNRTISFLNKEFDGVLPEAKLTDSDNMFISEVDVEIKQYVEIMENISLRKGIEQVMRISKLGNQFFQENAPWKSAREDKEKCGTTLNLCVDLVRQLAIIVEPYLPNTSKEMFRQLNLEPQNLTQISESIKVCHKINEPKPMFRKLEAKEIEEFRNKFSGKQDERKSDEPVDKKSGFEILNLKVAQIKEINDHPEADKLYVMKIDLGTEERQLVAGLKAYLTKEELLGKKIVVVSNLKPAKLRGVESQGMLLAADAKVATDDGKIEVVKTLAPDKSKPGDQVYIDGVAVNDKQITIDDFFKLKMKVKDKKAIFDGKFLKTDSEEIAVDIADGAKIR